MHKIIIIFTDCGKESAKRGGTSGHSTGDESNTFDVSCSKILFNGHTVMCIMVIIENIVFTT